MFVNYSIYKGKSALQVKVIKPTWVSVQGGISMDREGVVLLEFAPAIGKDGANNKYDWSKKQVGAT